MKVTIDADEVIVKMTQDEAKQARVTEDPVMKSVARYLRGEYEPGADR